jgi:hypothetical protein
VFPVLRDRRPDVYAALTRPLPHFATSYEEGARRGL